jgi:predicted O-methyltransferase YrrM
VREGTSVARRQDAPRDEDSTRAFIAAMDRNASERAPLVVRAVGNHVRRMLDLGGGSGAYSIAFAKAHPETTAEVFDTSAVLPLTQEYVRKAGLESRISTRCGDLRTDSFGSGYDLVFLSAIAHMFSPDENRSLLRRAFDALAPGGRLVLQDFILEPDKTAPKFAAIFSLNMLVNTEGGASYSEAEYTSWLREAGFTEVRHVPLPGPTGLMISVK